MRPCDPYEELARVPYEQLLAVDDGAGWQQALALMLLLQQQASEPGGWRGGVATLVRDDVLLRGCGGADIEALGLRYPPLESLLQQRVTGVDAWVVAHEARHSRAGLLAALAHVRRHAVLCESAHAGLQWALPPEILGTAMPCTSGGLEHFVEDGEEGAHLIVRAGSEGVGEGAPALSRRFGGRSNDHQLLEFGVAVPDNQAETFAIPGFADALLAAVEARGTVSAEAVAEMRIRADEISAFASWPGMSEGLLIRDADSLGPSWPGVPGPNLCDLNTLLLARWLTAPRDVLQSVVGSSRDESQSAEEWGQRVSGAMRQPLPIAAELNAWRQLLCLLEAELAILETERPDEQPTPATVVFRLDKTRLLASATAQLTGCIYASSPSSLALAPEVELTPGQCLPLEMRQHVDGLSDEFVAQAARMPDAVRELLVEGIGPSRISPAQLFRALRLPEATYRAAVRGAGGVPEKVMVRQTAVLDTAACAALRKAVDAAVLRTVRQAVDTVDGGPAFQLNLKVREMGELIGEGGLARLRDVLAQSARMLAADGSKEENAEPLELTGEGTEVFVRRYTAGGRPWIPFHCDAARLTLNIALCSESGFDGGNLLVVAGGNVSAVVRSEGEATIHASTLLHGVSRMGQADDGVRYSLIIFVGKAVVKGSA